MSHNLVSRSGLIVHHPPTNLRRLREVGLKCSRTFRNLHVRLQETRNTKEAAMSHRRVTLAAVAFACAASTGGSLRAGVSSEVQSTTGAEALIDQSGASASYPFCAMPFSTLGDFVANGTATFDTDQLTLNGTSGGVNIDGIAVFAFDSVQIPLGTTVVGQGSRPLAVLSKTTIQIDGKVTADGQSAVSFNPGPFRGGPAGGAGGEGG